MRTRLTALSMLMLGAVAACSPSGGSPRVASSAPVTDGVAVVTGGVAPCRGIPNPRDPKYAAATVTVLRGQLTWASAGPGVTAEVLPTEVAARVSVGVNGTYRFVLAPGHYVLTAMFAPPSNAEPFTQVAVHGGSAVRADIPNMCL